MSTFRRMLFRNTVNDITHTADTIARGNDKSTFQTTFEVYIESAYSSVFSVVGAICLIITLISAICKVPSHIPIIFGILGGLCLCIFAFLKLWRYKVDEDGVTDKFWFVSFRKIPWSSIKKVTLYKDRQDKTVTLSFYDDQRIRFDCSSLMIGYNNMKKMVHHKKIPISKVEKYRWFDWVRCKDDIGI